MGASALAAALTRPTLGRSPLSVLFRPRQALPITLTPRTENAQILQLYFRSRGCGGGLGDPRATLRNMFRASGDLVARAAAAAGVPRRASAWCRRARFARTGAPKTLPSWISESDIDYYGEEFKRTGFRGALNYYRNIDRNWEITGALAGLQVSIPALYIVGDHDFLLSFPGTDQLLANMKTFVPGLRKIQMLPGCGHWTQQERPDEVSAALVEFVRALPSRS